jgi:uncharacterized membrane protein
MIVEFLGKFHPLLVHLPIGFFLLAGVMKVYSFWKKKEAIDSLLPMMLILSFVASAFSSLTGYILSQSGDYDSEMVTKHQWTGILFTIIVSAVYFTKNFKRFNLALWAISTTLLMIVGHLGGSLTHGEDFLSFAEKTEKPQILDVQNAVVYQEIIQPILKERCYSCHSSIKQKGNLRLDTPEFIMKGGKEGKSVVPHNTSKSLISKRIFLKESDEEHMPPKGKPQLTEAETKILEWWIKEGASFDKKANQLVQSTEIKKVLASFQSSNKDLKIQVSSSIPEAEVEKGPEESILSLKKSGILVLPVASNSNYLLINLRGVDPSLSDIDALKTLRKQTIWLNATNIKKTEKLASVLSEMKEIRVLHLNKTSFSDKETAILKDLSNLQFLNLSNTMVSEKGLENLKGLKNLGKLYLYKSKVDFKNLNFKNFPKTKIDTGGYVVPTFETDTLAVKIPISD